jgi:hypothetical protein
MYLKRIHVHLALSANEVSVRVGESVSRQCVLVASVAAA